MKYINSFFLLFITLIAFFVFFSDSENESRLCDPAHDVITDGSGSVSLAKNSIREEVKSSAEKMNVSLEKKEIVSDPPTDVQKLGSDEDKVDDLALAIKKAKNEIESSRGKALIKVYDDYRHIFLNNNVRYSDFMLSDVLLEIRAVKRDNHEFNSRLEADIDDIVPRVSKETSFEELRFLDGGGVKAIIIEYLMDVGGSKVAWRMFETFKSRGDIDGIKRLVITKPVDGDEFLDLYNTIREQFLDDDDLVRLVDERVENSIHNKLK